MSRMSTRWDYFKGLGIAMGGAIAFWANCAFCTLCSSEAIAQITPDTTLPNNSTVKLEGNTRTIEGGTLAGGNLFHSFGEFSVPTGETAHFNNDATGIQNIISRVTGGSISKIDGLIRANGTANLFPINPSGIIFGKNASLNIGGSFVASTASSLKFADSTEFSATAPQTTPLLTISVPIGLQFGENPGRIGVQGDGQGLRTTSDLIDITAGLHVQPNQTLALVGGDVALSGGTLKTAAGRIELGSVAGGYSLVSLKSTLKGWTLGYEGVQNFRDIQLSQQATVDASGAGGGDIQVTGKNVVLQDGSRIEASTLGAEPGGTLSVAAKDSVEAIGTSADGQFSSGLLTQVYKGAKGSGGNLTINTNRLSIRNGAAVSTSTFGEGKAGSLTVKAFDVEVNGTSPNDQSSSNLVADVQLGATGSGGNLIIDTNRLSIGDGAQVGAGTFGEGNAGNLIVKASDVELSGTTPDSQFPSILSVDVVQAAKGSGGNLTIDTNHLSIHDGAQVGAGTFGEGNAGNLTVSARDVELNGTAPDGRTPSGLFTSAEEGATRQGGNLTLKTQNLSVSNKAVVAVNSRGSATAGDLEITSDSIQLKNQAILSAETRSGNGGNIKIQVQNLLLLRNNSRISTTAGTAQQPGNGGNITINAPSGFIVAASRENSNITANAFSGSGGKIQINATSIFGLTVLSREDLARLLGTLDLTQIDFQRLPSSITAISQTNPTLNGQVNLNTPDVDINRGLVALPAEVVDATRLIDQNFCAATSGTGSSFTITGRGGLPPSPNSALNSDAVWEDWRLTTVPSGDRHSPTARHKQPTNSTPNRIVEAQGWVVNAKGEVILTANPTTITPHSSWHPQTDCGTATSPN